MIQQQIIINIEGDGIEISATDIETEMLIKVLERALAIIKDKKNNNEDEELIHTRWVDNDEDSPHYKKHFTITAVYKDIATYKYDQEDDEYSINIDELLEIHRQIF